MKNKRLFIFLIVFVFILASCGSNSGGENNSNSGTEDNPTKISFYFPVAVGGEVAQIVEGLAEEFEEENPDIKVDAKFGGDYAETMTQVMAYAQSGNPHELAVLFSIDLYILIENIIIDEMILFIYDEILVNSFD